MSLDNVIGVAAAAKDNILLLVLGLAISIPMIIFASTVLLKLMERFPIIITIGAALLGFVAGEMAVGDPVTRDWVAQHAHWMEYAVPVVGALLVVGIGKFLAGRKSAEPA